MSDDPHPYQPPASDDAVVTAEIVRPPGESPRPVWTAILVCVAAIVLSATFAGVVLAIAAVVDQGPERGLEITQDMGRFMAWLKQFGQTREGLLLMLVPPQMVFLLVALAAALLSPRPLVRRLALHGGELPLWTWAVFLVATPLVGIFASQMLSLLVDELSETLKMVESILRFHADRNLWGVMFLVAVVPGVVEELMFRGYLQSRLVERWPPLLAILVSAVIFAAAHMDPIHILGVLPLGLWLGAIAWRADSVWPAVLCHAANNVVAVLGVKYAEAEALELGGTATWVILLLCVPAFLLSLYIFRSRVGVGRRFRSNAKP